MYLSKCGRFYITSDMEVLEIKEQRPNNSWHRARYKEQGPLFYIVYSSSQEEAAFEKEAILKAKYKDKVRIQLIPSRDELSEFAARRGVIIPVEDEPNVKEIRDEEL